MLPLRVHTPCGTRRHTGRSTVGLLSISRAQLRTPHSPPTSRSSICASFPLIPAFSLCLHLHSCSACHQPVNCTLVAAFPYTRHAAFSQRMPSGRSSGPTRGPEICRGTPMTEVDGRFSAGESGGVGCAAVCRASYCTSTAMVKEHGLIADKPCRHFETVERLRRAE